MQFVCGDVESERNVQRGQIFRCSSRYVSWQLMCLVGGCYVCLALAGQDAMYVNVRAGESVANLQGVRRERPRAAMLLRVRRE